MDNSRNTASQRNLAHRQSDVTEAKNWFRNSTEERAAYHRASRRASKDSIRRGDF